MSKLNNCPNCSHELKYIPIDTFKNTHICANCGSIFKNKTIVNIISYGVGVLLIFLINSPFRALIAYFVAIVIRICLTSLLGYRLTNEVVEIDTITIENNDKNVEIDIPNYDPNRLVYLLVAFVMSLVLFIIGVIIGTTISSDQHVIGKVMGVFNLIGFLYFQWMLVYVVRGKLYFKIKENFKVYIGYIIAWIILSSLVLYVFDMFTQNGYKDIINVLFPILISISTILVVIQYYFNQRMTKKSQ